MFFPNGVRGFLVGAVIGALVAAVQRLSTRVAELDRSLASLRASVARTAGDAARAPAVADTRTAAGLAAAPAAEPTEIPSAPAAPTARDAVARDDGRRQEVTAPLGPADAPAGPGARVPDPAAAGIRAQPAAKTAPVAPGPPTTLDRALQHALRWLTAGNLAVKAGVVVSLFGMGFLIKEG